MDNPRKPNRLFVKAGNPIRVFLMNSVIVLSVGIWLSGYEQVHWFLYVIPIIFALSALFGICPGINLWRILLKEK